MDVITTEVSWENRGESLNPEQDSGSMVNWVNVALLALASSVLPADGRMPQKHGPPVRVYVFTAEAGGATVSEEEQGRLDSVRDLSDALKGSRFILVPSADQAQLTVEITNREERDSAQGGFGGKSLTKFRETILRIQVKAGEDQSELKGIGRPSWGAAAKDAAKQLSSWVNNHHVNETGSSVKEQSHMDGSHHHFAHPTRTWITSESGCSSACGM